MTLTPDDLVKEARKQRAEMLGHGLRARLSAMREALEGARPLEALDQRQDVLAQLTELAELALTGTRPEGGSPDRGSSCALGAASIPDTDQASLQAFRRAAWEDLERLETRIRELSEGAWRSGADESRRARMRGLGLKIGIGLAVAAVLLAVWGGTQNQRRKALNAELDGYKATTALQATRLISLVAWQAVKKTGKPLSELVGDMSTSCSGMDVRTILPNSPCREEWAAVRANLFPAASPKPSGFMNAPSQIEFDPWGSPYILLIPKDGMPRVVSPGPDGRLGTPDDIGVNIPYWHNKPLP